VACRHGNGDRPTHTRGVDQLVEAAKHLFHRRRNLLANALYHVVEFGIR
jgi:hypothetical protein